MSKQILYIEDDPANMALVKRLLEAKGYQVLIASDGISGIEQAQTKVPHLILMDLRLPDFDGYDATLKLKSLEGLKNIPIIALTAKTDNEDRERALALGCNGYIPKPIDADTFPALIAEYLAGRRDKIKAAKKNKYIEEHCRSLLDKLEEKVTVSKKSFRELSALAELNNIINKSLEVQKVLHASINHVKKVLGAEYATIYKFDELLNELAPWSCRQKKADCHKSDAERCCKREADAPKRGKGIAYKSFKTGKSLLVIDSPAISAPNNPAGLTSAICTPLIVRNKSIGVLQATISHLPKVFNNADLRLLKLMGSQISIALENCILYEEKSHINECLEGQIIERTKEISIMLDASREGAASLNLKQVLHIFSQKLTKLLPSTCCRIAILDETGENLVIKSVYPVRSLDWTPRLGQVMPLNEFKSFDEIIKSKECMVFQYQKHQIDLSPQEEKIIFEDRFVSTLILPLTVNGTKIGIALLHEMRNWERWPFDQQKTSLCLALSNQMSVHIKNAQLYEYIRGFFLDTIKALGMTVDQRDPYTSNHSNKVSKYAVLIARQMKLSPEETERIRNAGLLHDIGKIGISDNILLKPGKFTPQEFEIIKTHPLKAVNILGSIRPLKDLIPIIAHHHEHYDGSGYNSHLKGEQIPIGARILAVVDAYDAMTYNRVYKKAISKQKALLELKQMAGTQFDPKVIKTFLRAIAKNK